MTAVWDGVSYCWEDDCNQPATSQRLVGMADDNLVVELVCPEHDTKETQ